MAHPSGGYDTKGYRRHYYWADGEAASDGRDLKYVTEMIWTAYLDSTAVDMTKELPQYCKAIVALSDGNNHWLPNENFGWEDTDADGTMGDVFGSPPNRADNLKVRAGSDNERQVKPHLQYQTAMKAKLDAAISKWTAAGEPVTWGETTPEEDLMIDALEIIRSNHIAEKLPLPFFLMYHTRDTEFGTDGFNPWASGGWMDYVHKPSIEGSPFDNGWIQNKYKDFWIAVRGQRQADALGIITKEKFIDEVIFKIDAYLPDIKFAKPGQNRMWHHKAGFEWPRYSNEDRNTIGMWATKFGSGANVKQWTKDFPPTLSFAGDPVKGVVGAAIESSISEFGGYGAGDVAKKMGKPWTEGEGVMYEPDMNTTTWAPTRHHKGPMPFRYPKKLFANFGNLNFADSVLLWNTWDYDQVTKDTKDTDISCFMPMRIAYDFVPWLQKAIEKDEGPFYMGASAGGVPDLTAKPAKGVYASYTKEVLKSWVDDTVKDRNGEGGKTTERAIMLQINAYQKHNASTWKSRFIDPPVPPDLSSKWMNLTDKNTWGNLITKAYDEGLKELFAAYDAYLAETSKPEDEQVVLDKHVLTYEFYDYENLHGFNVKENATTITEYFIDQTALFACAVLVGKYKQEAQNQFLLEVLKLDLQSDDDANVTDFDDIESDAVEALKDSGIQSKTPTPGAGRSLSAEEIEKRQKFFKQCALMLNLEEFVDANRKYITNKQKQKFSYENYHGNLPYDSRFWMLEDQEDQASSLNKLYCPQDLGAFLNIPQAIVNMLVPKLRIYQVYDGQDGLEQVEFQFEQQGLGQPTSQEAGGVYGGATSGIYEERLSGWTGSSALAKQNRAENKRQINFLHDFPVPAQRMANLWRSEFDRGNGAGIKSCEIIYEGTTPATARNDIQVKLSLYFQSFNDFFRLRRTSTGQQYKFVDLVLYPKNDEKSASRQKQGEYDPANYRIRLDVGWQIPPEDLRAKINSIAEKHFSFQSVYETKTYYDDLCDIIAVINKSYYLNMVDHNIDIKDTGACEIKIDYRAYIESAMKTNRFNALLDPTTYEVKRRQDAALEEARKKECTRKDFIALRREIDSQNEKIVQQSHQSIIKRLLKRKKIFYLDLFHRSKEEFERQGYFTSRPRYKNFDKDAAKDSSGLDSTGAADHGAAAKAAKEGETGGNTFVLLKEDFVDEDIGKNVRCNYFFMGDLIYTILDVIFDLPGTKQDLKNTRLLLGSFEYVDFDGVTRVANVADIPVSADYFFEWYTKHVVSAKRTTFPVMYFIRTLCNHLITDLLGDKCRNKSLILKTRFNTGSFLAAPGMGNTDPFLTLFKYQNNKKDVVLVSEHYNSGALPLPHIDINSDTGIKDFYNFMMVYPLVSPMINHKGVGNEIEDAKRGVAHIHLGGQVGIVKKVNFEKTDIQYIRESRFLNQGDDGYLQLGAVYKASIDMVGNTIWYPGMELFINPLGIGGMELGLPSDGGARRSKANALGLGGYHIITRVTSNIVPGKFSTKLEAQFHYSGDGLSEKQRLGFFKADEKKEIEQVAKVSSKCKTILDKLEQTTAEIGSGGIEEASGAYTFTGTKQAKEEGWEKSQEALAKFNQADQSYRDAVEGKERDEDGNLINAKELTDDMYEM